MNKIYISISLIVLGIFVSYFCIRKISYLEGNVILCRSASAASLEKKGGYSIKTIEDIAKRYESCSVQINGVDSHNENKEIDYKILAIKNGSSIFNHSFIEKYYLNKLNRDQILFLKNNCEKIISSTPPQDGKNYRLFGSIKKHKVMTNSYSENEFIEKYSDLEKKYDHKKSMEFYEYFYNGYSYSHIVLNNCSSLFSIKAEKI